MGLFNILFRKTNKDKENDIELSREDIDFLNEAINNNDKNLLHNRLFCILLSGGPTPKYAYDLYEKELNYILTKIPDFLTDEDTEFEYLPEDEWDHEYCIKVISGFKSNPTFRHVEEIKRTYHLIRQ